jgi:hypothetical protein
MQSKLLQVRFAIINKNERGGGGFFYGVGETIESPDPKVNTKLSSEAHIQHKSFPFFETPLHVRLQDLQKVLIRSQIFLKQKSIKV